MSQIVLLVPLFGHKIKAKPQVIILRQISIQMSFLD